MREFIRPEMADNILRPKILELFGLRLIPELIDLAKIASPQSFTGRLIDLQEAIYVLDNVLETQWDIQEEDLEPCWQAIFRCIGKFGIRGARQEAFCGALYQYLFSELEMRNGRWPSAKSLEVTYSNKSCDVKMMRSLIYREAPALEKVFSESAWHWYDLMTEVYDDLSDVTEDKDTFNGNVFLIMFLKEGPEVTIRSFKQFIDQVAAHANLAIPVERNTGLAQRVMSKIRTYHTFCSEILEQSNGTSASEEIQGARIARFF